MQLLSLRFPQTPRREFADRVELQEAVIAILAGIEQVALGDMFLTWVA
jgi:hypothetical protein